MRILNIKKLKNGKYKLTLDNGEILELYDDVILKSNILYTKEVNEELLKEINKDNSYYSYYTYSGAYRYYHSYYSTLINDGYDVLDVNSITVGEINAIVEKVGGSELPLEEWYINAEEMGYDYVTENGFYILGSIKDYVPEEYNWLWSTTYWTRTFDDTEFYIYFIDTLGDLCLSHYCQGAIGAGLRPIVTMSVSSIEFNVYTEDDGLSAQVEYMVLITEDGAEVLSK